MKTQSICERYELHFQSLFDPGKGYAFPCDERGRVDMNDLSERSLINYLYSRAVVGLEFHAPAVRVVEID